MFVCTLVSLWVYYTHCLYFKLLNCDLEPEGRFKESLIYGYAIIKSEEWMAYRDFKSLVAKIQNELEYAVDMRIQALFMKEKPSWNLVMYSILQVVDAFYAALQIRCAAHNQPIAEVTEYKITYQKGPTFSFDVYCCTH